MFAALNRTLTARRTPWPELAALAARAGFAGVDPDIDAAMAAGVASTLEVFQAARVRPSALPLPVDPCKDEEHFQAGLQALPAAARFASAIGCPRMATRLLPSREIPKEQERLRMKRRIAACADILRGHGVWLGLENLGPLHLRRAMPFEFIYRTEEMLDFAVECGPNVGLLLDSWHWHHSGGTAAGIAAAAGRIVHVHLADSADLPADEVRDMERLMPGEGVIDLDGFLRALQAAGYDGAVSTEVFGRGLAKMTPDEGARLGAETTLATMRKAGVA